MKKAIILLLLTPLHFFAQIDTIKWRYDDIANSLIESLESYIEEQDENVDLSEMIPDYLFSKEEKIDINNLSPEVAYTLLKLSEYQYYQLQLYLENYGVIVSLSELYAIEGFSTEDVDKIILLLKVSPKQHSKTALKTLWRQTRHRLLFRYGQVIEKQKGYDKNTKNGYLGSPLQLSLRYQAVHSKFSLGLSGEKDAGEQFFKGTQKQGCDFYAFHFGIKNIAFIKQIVLGDYRLNYGQGLVLGSGFGNGKSGNVNQVRKFTTAITPVTPLSESRFFRGTAIEMGNANYRGTLFWGFRHFDGKIEKEGNDRFFTGSLNYNGYHRTANEISKKNKLQSQNFGFNFQINRKVFRLGISGIMTHFSSLISSSSIFYKKYDFIGKNHFNVGIDHQIILKRSILFGEIAMSKGYHFALLQGIMTDLDPRFRTVIVFRYYDKSFISLEGSALGESSSNRNEWGIYFVSQLLLGRYTELHLGYDIYHFPWLKFQVDFPSYGQDLVVTLHNSLSKYSKLLLRYKFKKYEKNISLDYYNGASQLHKHQFRGTLLSSIFYFLNLKTEIDYVISKTPKAKKGKHGILLFQDIDFISARTGITLKGRLALFDTETFEERIYAYEKDLLFAFNSYAYYGKGCRFYIIFQYDYKFLQLQLRYSQTYYDQKRNIGSGLTLIEGPKKSDIKLQLYLKL